MSLPEKALEFAVKAHEGQKDDEGKLFIMHPVAVASILSCIVPEDENLIAAAFLHDVIEDTTISYEEIRHLFGADVANLVREVTKEVPEDKSKPATFPNLKTQRGIVLKFADRLHNLSRMKSWSKKKRAWYLTTSQFWKT